MMNFFCFLWLEMIFVKVVGVGRKVVMVIVKDKLCELFFKGFNGIVFLIEKVEEVKLESYGVENVCECLGEFFEIYLVEVSVFVFKVGVDFIEKGEVDFCYFMFIDFM